MIERAGTQKFKKKSLLKTVTRLHALAQQSLAALKRSWFVND